MRLCIVKHKIKTNNGNSFRKKSLGNYDTEDSTTKEKCLCFEVCALCLSSTMESSKLYMWQIWWNVDDIQRLVVLGFAHLFTIGLASSSDHLSKLLAHYIVLVP